MKHRIQSASGAPQEPLPADVPTDADHITTPRDHRAEQLAAEVTRWTEELQQLAERKDK